MSGEANYVHLQGQNTNLTYTQTRWSKTNITKLFGVKKTCCLMMPNHIQHSGQVVVYHNQLTYPTPEYSLVSSAKLTSLDADTSLSISEIINQEQEMGPKRFPVGHHLTQGGLH